MPDVAPTIGLLRRHAEEIRRAEVARAGARLSVLAPEERDAVEVVTAQIVQALLHTPTTRIAEAAAQPEGSRYDAVLRDLFALDEAV
jgi:glutamyl-tRNA reductase